jgi:predicted GTPase
MMSNEAKAIEFYEKNLRRMREYYANHKDTMRVQMASRYQQMKEDPERYKEYLENKRAMYRSKRTANLGSDSVVIE